MTNKPVGSNRLLHVFGRELVEAESVVSKSFIELRDLAKFQDPPAHLIHRELRRILTEAAVASLVFFPQRGSGNKAKLAKTRADFLRDEFKVNDNSMLANRAIRNHFAHLDERLDHWAMESTNRTFGRQMLGSRSDAKRLGILPEDILGLFDPKTFVFCFLEDDLQVDDLVGEIRTISHVVQNKLRDLPWDQEVH